MKAALITEEQIKAIEAALEVSYSLHPGWADKHDEAIGIVKSLKVQEPVAWEYKNIKPGWKSTKFLELQAEPPEGGWKDYKETPLYALGDEK